MILTDVAKTSLNHVASHVIGQCKPKLLPIYSTMREVNLAERDDLTNISNAIVFKDRYFFQRYFV